MNFEELVETRDVRKSNKVKMPFGYFHKRQIDGKYSNFVEFVDELSDNILFAECLKKDCEVAAQVSTSLRMLRRALMVFMPLPLSQVITSRWSSC